MITLIEYAGALLAIAYLVLVTRRRWLAWPSYIASSLCYIPVFWSSRLYSNASLQVLFVAMGIWGWLSWRHQGAEVALVRWPLKRHGMLVALLTAGVCGIGSFVQHLSGVGYLAFADAFISVSSIVATVLTVLRVVENWWYWIAINVVCVIVYAWQGMLPTCVLMALYAVLSLRGLIVWRRSFR